MQGGDYTLIQRFESNSFTPSKRRCSANSTNPIREGLHEGIYLPGIRVHLSGAIQ